MEELEKEARELVETFKEHAYYTTHAVRDRKE